MCDQVAPPGECLRGKGPPDRMLVKPWRRLFLAAYTLWAKPCCVTVRVSCHCCPVWQTVVLCDHQITNIGPRVRPCAAVIYSTVSITQSESIARHTWMANDLSAIGDRYRVAPGRAVFWTCMWPDYRPIT